MKINHKPNIAQTLLFFYIGIRIYYTGYPRDGMITVLSPHSSTTVGACTFT